MSGWMTCDITSVATVFQPRWAGDNERMCAMEPRLGMVGEAVQLRRVLKFTFTSDKKESCRFLLMKEVTIAGWRSTFGSQSRLFLCLFQAQIDVADFTCLFTVSRCLSFKKQRG